MKELLCLLKSNYPYDFHPRKWLPVETMAFRIAINDLQAVIANSISNDSNSVVLLSLRVDVTFSK